VTATCRVGGAGTSFFPLGYGFLFLFLSFLSVLPPFRFEFDCFRADGVEILPRGAVAIFSEPFPAGCERCEAFAASRTELYDICQVNVLCKGLNLIYFL
jgi:hypothetical protein